MPRKFMKLQTIFLFFYLIFSSYELSAQTITTPSGELVKITLAMTSEEQAQGLSGKKPHEFGDHEGMLFYNKRYDEKRFWMPDTYFDLDIYFLDEKFKILAVEKNTPHHPGRNEPPEIYRTKTYRAMHVLEMKSSSKISQKLKVGDALKFTPKK